LLRRRAQRKLLVPTFAMSQLLPHWEHFEHDADVGVRGLGHTRAEAFEQAAVAMTAAITEPALVRPLTRVEPPGAYKDVSAVVEAADRAGLARTVPRLTPVVCVKG
jgi:RNA-splicing ligase RtcB